MWIRHTLSQNSLFTSITGLFRVPDIQTTSWSCLWKQLLSCAKATPSQFGPWDNGKWELPLAVVAEPMAEPWSHSWEQIARASQIQCHLPSSLGFLDSPNQLGGSLCARTPVQSGNTTIPIPICLSEICKHLKCITKIAQGAKPCPSVSELACD